MEDCDKQRGMIVCYIIIIILVCLVSMLSFIDSEILDSFTEENKRKLDYVFNFDFVLYNREDYINLINDWNLEEIKFLFQPKDYNFVDGVYKLMKKLA